MSGFLWVGDGKDEADGFKAKNQMIVLESGSDQYFAYGDVRYQMINSRGGNDLIVGAKGAIVNSFYGDSISMSYSKGGNDWLIGSDAANFNDLYGDADTLSRSKGGSDVLIGGANANMNNLFGDAVAMLGDLTNMSSGGNDTLFGGDGASLNYLYGDAIFVGNSLCGYDFLVAGDLAQENYLYGDGYQAYENAWGGNDRLVSGTGNDYMWGDFQWIGADTKFGRDTFVFKTNNGQDKIFDFRSGEDKIEISGIAGLADFSQLQMQITVQGGASIIALGTDDTVTVIGVTNLQAQDFIFS